MKWKVSFILIRDDPSCMFFTVLVSPSGEQTSRILLGNIATHRHYLPHTAFFCFVATEIVYNYKLAYKILIENNVNNNGK